MGDITDLNEMQFYWRGLAHKKGIYHTCRSCNVRVDTSKDVGTITPISKFGWLCNTCLQNPNIYSLLINGSTDRYTGLKRTQSQDSIDSEPDEMQELEDLQKFQDTIDRAEHRIQILRAGIEVKQRRQVALQKEIEGHRTRYRQPTFHIQKQCQLRLIISKKQHNATITREIQGMSHMAHRIQTFVSKMKNPLSNGSSQEDKQNVKELKKLLDTIPPIPTHTE